MSAMAFVSSFPPSMMNNAHKAEGLHNRCCIAVRCMTTKYIFVFILERTRCSRASFCVQLMTMSVERIARETDGKNQFWGKGSG